MKPTVLTPAAAICSAMASDIMMSFCGVLNTHFFTGSTMTLAPASEMNGICASSSALDFAVRDIWRSATTSTVSARTR